MLRKSTVREWKSGLITNVEAYSLPEDAASDALNWLTEGDKITLRRGYSLVGTEVSGVNKVTGLIIPRKSTGATQPFFTYDRKIKYYDSSTTDWVEIGTNSLPSGASGEDISFAPYTSLAGYQLFAGSPNSSLYKIMIANPGTLNDVYNSAKNFKGYLKMGNGRSFLWNTKVSSSSSSADTTNLNGSWIDAQDSTVYTTVSGESAGTGTGAQVTFTGTLAFKAGGARRTCFAVTFTDSVETFTENRNGTLTGSAGGTGTINYSSGAFSITFAVAPLNLAAITTSYQWEDSSVKGVVDYSKTATRVAGEGFFVPQGDGGKLQSVEVYKDNLYCLHEFNTWFFNMPATDTNPTNRVFRNNAGIKNWRGAVSTGDGILFIDASSPSSPYIRLLTYDQQGTEVVPIVVTYNLNLASYDFTDASTFEWGDYILYSCRSSSSVTANNRIILYNKKWKSIDLLDYGARVFADKDGVLWSGDSLSANVLQLFSGFTDNGTIITNHWIGNISRLGIDELKKYKRITVEGEIASTQSVTVSISYDRGSFVELGTISGSGSYVDSSNPVTVGSVTVGSKEVGGGDSVTAFHYRREFLVRSGSFYEVQLKFEATDVGYVSISTREYFDLQLMGQRNLQRYQSTTPIT